VRIDCKREEGEAGREGKVGAGRQEGGRAGGRKERRERER
jgi:hypothetical protein